MSQIKSSLFQPRIRRAADRDINQLVRIHLQAIPYSINSRLGPYHLSGVYRRILELLVCEVWVISELSKVIAFGVLEYHPQAVATCLLQSHSVDSIFLLILKILQKPAIILALLQECCSSWIFRKSRGPLLAQPHILVIGVNTPFRNRGIGKKLLRALVFRAKKRRAKFLSLETRRDNAGALRFYIGNGFRIVKKSPFDVLLAKKI
jgi:GNAT superfamily N-acetyltransferase